MKKKNLLILTVLLVMVGTFSCEKEKNIDYSNIEDLYAQPLPVIKKAVQGKWKLYSTCGGFAGCSYPENRFITRTPNEIIVDSDKHLVVSYSWKKKKVDIFGEMVNSYVMWPDRADETTLSGEYFISIQNDTLYAQDCSLTSNYTVFSFIYVRVK
ncbi:hypothetical protein FACS1894180_0590 [Bacteroidia bacterium]|nr:hypothetical protein FACS1894178_7690 [Bacteroidia bacterium]GHV42932.1 hypothetical protein FACS1894180_0590 [Bacteroidia bacterium]